LVIFFLILYFLTGGPPPRQVGLFSGLFFVHN
jgi:hypothetical protein